VIAVKSFKKSIIIAFIAVFLTVSAIPAAYAATPRITAVSALLMDGGTGQVIFQKNGFVRKEPASLTKIITAIIALEYGHPEEVVTISKRTANISVGQQLGLNTGDRLTLENLIKAALMYSANDSTVAIAEHIAGAEERFVDRMNARALVLGALNTRFANTNGYHNPNHYSTAYDLALITRYALTNPDFSRIIRTPQDTIHWADGEKKLELRNTNRLVREESYQGILGVKTGSTIRAGNCLIAAARRGDRTLIAVVLHSRNRYKDAVSLLDFGFDKTTPVKLCQKGDRFGKITVAEGVKSSVEAVGQDGINIYLTEEDREKVTVSVLPQKPLPAPVHTGQRVGTAIFSLGKTELARVNLVSSEEVEKPGLLHKIKSALPGF